MQIEPMPKDDGYRCWLSPTEQDLLTDHYSQEPKKRLAVELMLDGLRSEEVPRVATRDFRRLDGKKKRTNCEFARERLGGENARLAPIRRREL